MPFSVKLSIATALLTIANVSAVDQYGAPQPKAEIPQPKVEVNTYPETSKKVNSKDKKDKNKDKDKNKTKNKDKSKNKDKYVTTDKKSHKKKTTTTAYVQPTASAAPDVAKPISPDKDSGHQENKDVDPNKPSYEVAPTGPSEVAAVPNPGPENGESPEENESSSEVASKASDAPEPDTNSSNDSVPSEGTDKKLYYDNFEISEASSFLASSMISLCAILLF
jgi:hypothetical protein